MHSVHTHLHGARHTMAATGHPSNSYNSDVF